MKTLATFVLAASFAFAVAPQDGQKDPAPKKAESQPSADLKGRRMGPAVPVLIEKDREVYGSEVQFKEATKLSEVIKDPKAYAGRTIRVDGQIDTVCQKKGCWIFIKDGDQRAMVKFNGYSFFVPLDVAGRTVKIEAMAKEQEIPEAMRRHYAEDAGKSKEEIEKIKGPEKVVMFVATGVEIGPPAKAAESKPAAEKAKG